MRHPVRALSPEAADQERCPVFPEDAAKRRPEMGHRWGGRGAAAALRPQGQRGRGRLLPGAQAELGAGAGRLMAHLRAAAPARPAAATAPTAPLCRAEPGRSAPGRAVRCRCRSGGTCGAGAAGAPQERLCPLLPLMRGSRKAPEWSVHTPTHSHPLTHTPDTHPDTPTRH